MKPEDRTKAVRLAENLKAMYAFPDVVLFLERLAAEPEQEPAAWVWRFPDGLFHVEMTATKPDLPMDAEKFPLYRDPPIRELNHAAIERIRKESGVDAWWDAGYEDREEFYEMIDKFARASVAAARGKA